MQHKSLSRKTENEWGQSSKKMVRARRNTDLIKTGTKEGKQRLLVQLTVAYFWRIEFENEWVLILRE
eukprot:406814-Rhodomonas_salina.1